MALLPLTVAGMFIATVCVSCVMLQSSVLLSLFLYCATALVLLFCAAVHLAGLCSRLLTVQEGSSWRPLWGK